MDLFKFLHKMTINKNKPDLHSFTAIGETGHLFVEAHDDGITITHNGKADFTGNAMQVCNRLELIHKINTDSIEM